MRYAILVSFSVLFPSMAFPSMASASAEDHSVESAVVFQQVCETALDDLLHGNLRGFDELTKISPPTERMLATRLCFRTEYERTQATRGNPIDWKPVGTKRIGNVCCRCVYMCRYDRAPVFWSFTGINLRGRWHLASLKWDGNTTAVLDAIYSSRVEEKEEYLPLCNRVADLLANRKREAFDVAKEHFTSQSPSSHHMLNAISDEYLARYSGLGDPLRCEPVYTKNVADALAQCCYVAQYETGHLVYEFTLYRPKTKWKFVGFNYYGNDEVLFAKLPLALGGNSAPVRTAKSPQAASDDATELK